MLRLLHAPGNQILDVYKRQGYFQLCGNDRGRPGYDDIINWDEVFEAFKEVGFDGYAGFEGFDMTCDSIYRDIIGDPVQFAKDSLEFTLEMMDKYGFRRG